MKNSLFSFLSRLCGTISDMTFNLTNKIVDEIIFAMENQNSLFVFDAEKNQVVPIDSEIVAEDFVEKQKGYVLPSWDSDDGFNLLEEFAETVREQTLHVELNQILSNGRGVFKNFKIALKKYPAVERRFHSFKEKKMRSVVLDWYNSLRENWGLDAINPDNFEDSDDLLREDFQFGEYNPKEDKDCVAKEAGEIAKEIKAFYPEEVGSAIAHIWLRKFNDLISDSCGFICRTTSDDFAGCLLFSLEESSENRNENTNKNQNTAFLTVCFVNQNYRCLGIMQKLFFYCISSLKKRGIHWFIIAENQLPEFLEPLLNRCGFEKIGSVYLANVADN